MNDEADVLILGAGAAGLRAAQVLREAGRRVLLLEARTRLGGRIHTVHPPGWPVPVEAGAEFVHGGAEATWEIAKPARLESYEIVERHWLAEQGVIRPLDFEDVWEGIAERLPRERSADRPFNELLNACCRRLSERDRELALAYVEGFNAADGNIVSSQWLHETDAEVGAASGGAEHRFVAGYHALLAPLTADLKEKELRLGAVVRAIRWRPGHVEVKAAIKKTTVLFHAPRALITLPLGVLQARDGEGAVRFDPDPLEKRRIWNELKMGAVIKLIVRFRERFWADLGLNDLGFLHTPAGPFLTWWSTAPRESDLLTAWVGGPAADRLSGRDPDELKTDALTGLAHALGRDPGWLHSLVVDWRLFDWRQDPFSRGAYSYVPARGFDLPRQWAEPIANTLFFAGEATDALLAGTVAGALASGKRAATEILR